MKTLWTVSTVDAHLRSIAEQQRLARDRGDGTETVYAEKLNELLDIRSQLICAGAA